MKEANHSEMPVAVSWAGEGGMGLEQVTHVEDRGRGGAPPAHFRQPYTRATTAAASQQPEWPNYAQTQSGEKQAKEQLGNISLN